MTAQQNGLNQETKQIPSKSYSSFFIENEGECPNTNYLAMATEYSGREPNNSLVTAASDGISFSTLYSAALVQASLLNFTNVSGNSFIASWSNGNNTNRAVFIKAASTGNAVPTNDTTYTAINIFGSGTQIGNSGWYCVYNGTDSSVSISGLSSNTSYRIMVCEYSGSSGNEQYNTDTATLNPATQVTNNYTTTLGLTKYGQITTNSKNFIDKYGKVDSVARLDKFGQTILFSNCGTVSDICGNTYNTVVIGTQCWMLQNLKTIKYRNGDSIPNVSNTSAWAALLTGGYCNYNNDPANGETYGHLYNWYTLYDSRKICPIGWHIPSDAEWSTLETYLGGSTVAGAKLKEAGTTHWTSPNTGATNSSNFTALPAGIRWNSGFFYYLGTYGRFWSSNEYSTLAAWEQYVENVNIKVTVSYSSKAGGYSIRCLHDQ